MTRNTAATRLLPELPPGDFIDQPIASDRFLLRIGPNGEIFFMSTHSRIEEFLQLCTEAGLNIHVDHISRCG
jgi:hypothetical protein